ncbi:MAG: glycosyltransferase [Candidatus Paracaedimonas acanthamoebae]|uniref:Glycosyltransferase n=1 Tax=Candidatus Paracaedimonas acanthamoebae TaxID=244581 RepID=A0A8J7PI97_9PROT|nr:glycosyltransferase [Candidatus Paracaedimonas acanthamoebae]
MLYKLKTFIKKYPFLYKIFVSLYLKLHPKIHLSLPHHYKLLLKYAFFLERDINPLKHRNNNNNKIVMLAISEIFRDPRIEREARTLRDAGFEIKIIYIDYFSAYHNIQEINWGTGITFRPIPFDGNVFWEIFPYLFSDLMINAACEEEVFAIHAHDLSTALMGAIAAEKIGAYFVCDFHEWFSENVGWNYKLKKYVKHPFLKKKLYQWAEKICLRKANRMITVCDSIARDINLEIMPKPFSIIRNIPFFEEEKNTSSHPSLRDLFGIKKENFPLVLLWQGGVGPTRLIEPIIEGVSLVPGVFFVIRGPGMEYYQTEYEKLIQKLGAEDRVKCLMPIPSSEVVAGAKGADLGVWSLPNLCKNFTYSLPNKIFEYMVAGVPILAADYPEVRKIVSSYDIGMLFDPYSPKSIAQQLEKVKNNQVLLKTYQKNLKTALEDNSPSKEWEKLTSLYNELRSENNA